MIENVATPFFSLCAYPALSPVVLTNNPNLKHLQHAVKFHLHHTPKSIRNDRTEIAQAQVSACQEPRGR